MSRFLPPLPLKQLEDGTHEELYSIPLETTLNLYESVAGRIQAVFQANAVTTLY
jgi:hypothetical protein